MEMDPVASSRRLPETRERILRGFEAWLDSALVGEEPLQGVAADLFAVLERGDPLPAIEGHCDLYSLWSAMTALTQEVKLQSRTFRQLNDTLSQATESSGGVTPSNRSAPQAATDEHPAALPETERRARAELSSMTSPPPLVMSRRTPLMRRFSRIARSSDR